MDWFVLLTLVVSLVAGFLSGLSGGGGGFIMTPYFIWIGLSPQQAIATGKMGSLGTAFGSIAAFKGKGLVHKKLVVPFLLITGCFAIVSAWLLPQIDPIKLQQAIGILLIVLVPTLFINKPAFQPGERSKAVMAVGFVAYAVFSFLQTLVGAGLGSILVLVLMFLFGLGALEAQATKRVAQVVQAIILFVLLSLQQLVVFWHGLAVLVGMVFGCHLGTKFAISKSNKFVKVVLGVMMFVSGVSLLASL